MKRVLITGANRGLGFHLAKCYASNGWQVYACCRHPWKARHLKNMALNVSVIKLDVTSPRSIRRLAKKLQSEPIDILINNAGLMEPLNSKFGSITSAKPFQEVFAVNTIGPYLVIQALFHNLMLGKTSKIIANISSDMGSMNDDKIGGYYIYRSSKAALNSITKSLAIDFKTRGITVVALHPGWVKTDMGGLHAQISPQESAEGLYNVLNSIQLKDSGHFFNYLGEQLSW